MSDLYLLFVTGGDVAQGDVVVDARGQETTAQPPWCPSFLPPQRLGATKAAINKCNKLMNQ